jgi:GntR family transcriptional regulator, rspAB operon transcriptional repressor
MARTTSRPAPSKASARTAARSEQLLTRVRAGSLSLTIQHESLEDKIYAQLRGLVVGRKILQGERIPVDDLAREMGVSRTPVLNALKRLAQERVVEVFSRRGIYVRRFTKHEMARLYAVREVLEGLAARLAAARIVPAEVGRLAASFQGFEGPLSAAATQRYVQRDRAFHARLVTLADSEQLTAALESVYMMFFAYQDGLVRPPAETLPEHQAILEALGRRDPEASEAAMRRHLRRSMERLKAQAEAEPQDTDQGLRPMRR